MTAPRRLSVKLDPQPALSVTRVSVGADRLVYVFVCNKKLRYGKKRSRIAYVGTTKSGVWRVTASAAARAKTILAKKGVISFEARIVTCGTRKGLKKNWHKLERALLLSFREAFGVTPTCNIQGKNIKEKDEFRYFARARVKQVIEDLS